MEINVPSELSKSPRFDGDDDDDCCCDDEDSGSECSFACFIYCHRLCFSVLISTLQVRSASPPPSSRRVFQC